MRSVLKLGRNTLVVSLPREWAVENKIRKGDKLTVRGNEGEITFSLKEKKPIGSIEIDLRGRSKSVYWKLAFAAYIRGYEEIILKNVEREKAPIIRTISDQLIGMALTNEKEKTFVLKELSRSNEDEFPNVFHKVYLLMKEIIKEGAEAIKKNDFSILKELNQRDWAINKFVIFCLRALNKSNEIQLKKKIFYYTTLTNLEQLGDVFIDFFMRIGKEKTKLENEEKALLREIVGLIENLSIIIYKPLLHKIIDIYEKRKELERKCSELKDKGIKTQYLWILKNLGNLIEAILPECI